MRHPAGVEHGEASGAGEASVAWHGVRRCFGGSGGAVMGVGMARAWRAVGVVGVVGGHAGEGASGVPIQRNLLDVYPALEL